MYVFFDLRDNLLYGEDKPMDNVQQGYIIHGYELYTWWHTGCKHVARLLLRFINILKWIIKLK